MIISAVSLICFMLGPRGQARKAAPVEKLLGDPTASDGLPFAG